MKTLTAKELQTQNLKRFKREYESWREYALDHDWWEYVYEGFKEDVRPFGVTVADIQFSVGYSQSDHAVFSGRIDVADFMQEKGWDETYPALYLAVKDCGDYATVDTTYRSNARVNYDGACVGNTYPAGVFTNLEQDAWDELVEEQYSGAGLEDEMQSYVSEVCDDLYRTLRDESEHLLSEESFIESCECNDITFEIEEENHEICA